MRNPRCLPGACVKQHRAREAQGLRISGRAADPGPAGKRTREHRGTGGSIRLDSAEPGVPAQAPLPLQGRALETRPPPPPPRPRPLCTHTPGQAGPGEQGLRPRGTAAVLSQRLPGKLTRRRGGEGVFLGKRKEDRDTLEKSENPETAKRANLTQNSEYKWCEKPHFSKPPLQKDIHRTPDRLFRNLPPRGCFQSICLTLVLCSARGHPSRPGEVER